MSMRKRKARAYQRMRRLWGSWPHPTMPGTQVIVNGTILLTEWRINDF